MEVLVLHGQDAYDRTESVHSDEGLEKIISSCLKKWEERRDDGKVAHMEYFLSGSEDSMGIDHLAHPLCVSISALFGTGLFYVHISNLHDGGTYLLHAQAKLGEWVTFFVSSVCRRQLVDVDAADGDTHVRSIYRMYQWKEENIAPPVFEAGTIHRIRVWNERVTAEVGSAFAESPTSCFLGEELTSLILQFVALSPHEVSREDVILDSDKLVKKE